MIQRQAEIPRIGYGTWNREGKEAYHGVIWALEAGYRHIDTAQGYHNEEEVGRAIADAGIARSEIFVTTKVATENYGKGQVRASTQRSLDKLGLNQLDLLLLHWPSPHEEYPLESYVAQLAEVFDAGLTKWIGLSNFTIPLIDKTVALLGDRPVATNQIEIHPYFHNAFVSNHCRQLGIAITAYCPLARGALQQDPVLTAIAAANSATIEQVALAFLMAEGHIVIPSSKRRERIASNFEATRVQLQPRELAEIRKLDRGLRLVDGDWVPVWDKQ